MGRSKKIPEPSLSFYRWRPEAQRVQVTCPKSQSKPVTEPELHHGLSTHRPVLFPLQELWHDFHFALWRRSEEWSGAEYYILDSLWTSVTSAILASTVLAVVASQGNPSNDSWVLSQLALSWLRVPVRAGAVPPHMAQDLSVCKQAEGNLLTLLLGPTFKQTPKQTFLLQGSQIRVTTGPTVQNPGAGPAGSLQRALVEVDAQVDPPFLTGWV